MKTFNGDLKIPDASSFKDTNDYDHLMPQSNQLNNQYNSRYLGMKNLLDK